LQAVTDAQRRREPTRTEGAAEYSTLIRLTAIEKSFGPVKANRGASLDVADGEIHALVGENGAGKSTLMRILSGMFQPDAGGVEVSGRDVTGWRTADAIGAGVGMVHQHFMLVPTLTVTENVTLGAEITRNGQLDRAKAQREVQALVDRTGLAVPVQQRVGDLTVGEAQRVEILKTLYRGARILILDEPTAVLSPPEVNELWRVLRRLRDEGGTIVLITHKLDEVMSISDTITVMRQGETVGRLKTAQTSPAEIAKMMVGRDVVLAGETDGHRTADIGDGREAGSRPHLRRISGESLDAPMSDFRCPMSVSQRTRRPPRAPTHRPRAPCCGPRDAHDCRGRRPSRRARIRPNRSVRCPSFASRR